MPVQLAARMDNDGFVNANEAGVKKWIAVMKDCSLINNTVMP